jgi:hypothetical protein
MSEACTTVPTSRVGPCRGQQIVDDLRGLRGQFVPPGADSTSAGCALPSGARVFQVDLP